MLGSPRVRPHLAAVRMRVLPWFARFSLSAGGLGYARFASGTWGSLPPCVLVLGLVWAGQPAWVINTSLLLLGLWGAVACVRFGLAAERAVGLKDPGCVVADEVAGMCIALAGLRWAMPPEEGWLTVSSLQVLWAFLAFRAADIVKPPPCRQLQALRGGWGILADDVLAGVYASVFMHVIGALR